ncbi:hypothetical protein IV203_027127 [Nitzschia inconspicua]|uniref:DUF6824 domain-containing protein n=1 Tax=Nitzschia inconspicua TaxID=303405 RepID=A0A9K3LNT3_9STRA|nr:hypothetical protein IV203_027127 [Nitzschia inconspicua]
MMNRSCILFHSSPREGSIGALKEDCRISSDAIGVSTVSSITGSWQFQPKTLTQQNLRLSEDMKTDVRPTYDALSPSLAMEEKALPNGFKPSEFTVIIGRGKKVRETIGNLHLRTLATTYLSQYADALKNRQAKTAVVNNVLGIIRAVCPNGGAFVRRHNGRWYEVSDRVAREKVGYVFRDLLSDSYESSCKSKTAKRKMQQKDIEDLHQKVIDDAHLVLQKGLRPHSRFIPSVTQLFSSGGTNYEIGEQQIERAGGEYSSQASALVTMLQMPPKSRFVGGVSFPYFQTQGQQQSVGTMIQSPHVGGHQQNMLQMQYCQLSRDHLSNVSVPTNCAEMRVDTSFSTGGTCLEPLNAFATRQTPTGLSHDFLEAYTVSQLNGSYQNCDSIRPSGSATGTFSEELPSCSILQTANPSRNELLDILSPLLDCQIEKS